MLPSTRCPGVLECHLSLLQFRSLYLPLGAAQGWISDTETEGDGQREDVRCWEHVA